MNQARQTAWIGLGAFAAVCGIALSAHATLLTTDPGTGTTTVFTDTGLNSNPGPVTLDGFVWTGNPQVTYGTAQYGVGTNGIWSPGGEFSWIATNNGTGS